MRRERANKLTRQIILILLSLLLVSFAVFTLSTFSSGDISLYVLGETANSARHEVIGRFSYAILSFSRTSSL